MTPERPAIVEDKHLLFLDALRDSSVTNMFGAGPYLREAFPEMTRNDSHKVLGYWMDTYPRATAGKEANK